MKFLAMFGALIAAIAFLSMKQSSQSSEDAGMSFNPKLIRYVAESMKQFDEIPEDRKRQLQEISNFVRAKHDANDPIYLTFICTHNSRRSHFGQIWAQVAAAHFGVKNVTTYSGGTEATAFNPRAVEAVQRAGMHVERTTGGSNPIYHVRYADKQPAVTCFSKIYNGAPNATEDFAAVMTCSSADQKCPIVHGAEARIAIPYEDPKRFDGTDREAEAYDERCRQISREILYVFSRATSKP